jgi:uncharacterized protein (TIGR00290 family)
MEKAIFCWSSGKDSALALHEIRAMPEYEIVALLTTITEVYDRISLHGVRRSLVEQQAESLGLPLEEVFLPQDADNGQYEARMAEALTRHRAAGVTSVVFGDILLEDLRQYREDKLAPLGLKAVFPLWKRDTRALLEKFIQLGLKAVTTCVDTSVLGQEFVGREIDASFLAELPATVDPCGENGEYHSFAYDGPMFRHRIPFTLGEKVLRNERFYYCDLVPQGSRNSEGGKNGHPESSMSS